MAGELPPDTEQPGEKDSGPPPRSGKEKEKPRIEIKESLGVVVGDHARVIIRGIDERVFKRFGLGINLGFGLLALLMLSATALMVYLLLPKPVNMKEEAGCELCIAVAGFAQETSASDQKIGEEFGATLSQRLQENMAELKSQSDMTIEVWGPARVGALHGKNIEQLDEAAGRLAQETGVDILVYGLIQEAGDHWVITPRFYISPDYQFQDAPEIIGQDQLGFPFDVPGQPRAVRIKKMNDRASADGRLMAALAVGMTHYSTYEYEDAFKVFEAATADAGIVGESSSARLLYLMMGNSLLPQYEKHPDHPELLADARDYFQTALDSDTGYARPYIGLGSVLYLQGMAPAVISSNPADADLDLLAQSLEYYQKARVLAPTPDLAHVREKTHVNAGRVLLAKAYTQITSENQAMDLGPAANEFRQVIEAYEQAPDELLKSLAADAHASLALIARLEGRTADSLVEYQSALALTDNPDHQKLYRKAIATLQAPGP